MIQQAGAVDEYEPPGENHPKVDMYAYSDEMAALKRRF